MSSLRKGLAVAVCGVGGFAVLQLTLGTNEPVRASVSTAVYWVFSVLAALLLARAAVVARRSGDPDAVAWAFLAAAHAATPFRPSQDEPRTAPALTATWTVLLPWIWTAAAGATLIWPGRDVTVAGTRARVVAFAAVLVLVLARHFLAVRASVSDRQQAEAMVAERTAELRAANQALYAAKESGRDRPVAVGSA